MKSIVILISGRGSNMESLLKAVAGGSLPVLVAAVISNRPDAKGLEIAAAQDVETCVVDHTRFDSRESFDAAMIKTIDSYSPDLVVLAGFMRILTDGFVRHYDGRLLNIHPSLLPRRRWPRAYSYRSIRSIRWPCAGSLRGDCGWSMAASPSTPNRLRKAP